MKWWLAAGLALIPSAGMAQSSTTICMDMGHGTEYCRTRTPPPPITFSPSPTPSPSVAENIIAGQMIGSVLGNLLFRPRRKSQPITRSDPLPQWRSTEISPDTGNNFYDNCLKANAQTMGICYGYLQGFIAREQDLPSRFICFPTNGTFGQMMDTLLAYLRDNPADRNRSLGLLTYAAFYQAYPCAIPESAPPPGK